MINTKLNYSEIDDLYLDPWNPRLGRHHTERQLSQEQILEIMQDWTLEELAISFLENGFWPQEALLVVEEELHGPAMIVVEGNRRLAALKYLFRAADGNPPSRKWIEIARSATPEKLDRLRTVPYLKAESRSDVEAYLGFRHVTGIKQWNPAEKAEFISHLIDDRGMSYQEVMRKIGSTTPTVRQNYITYRLLLQMEDVENRIAIDRVEEKFSVLYLSLRTSGVRQYLQIEIDAEPAQARTPVPPDKLDALVNFARWLFGDARHEPVVTDSRQVDKFAKTLEHPEALAYLERSDAPNLETAYRKTGGDEGDLVVLITRATDNVQQALMSAHRYRGSDAVREAVRDFAQDARQLVKIFPEIEATLVGGVA
jgi:hypothetical protein